MSRFNWAPTAYRMLNGVFCLYKPEGSSVHNIIDGIKFNLCKDLNALPCYQHEIPLTQTHVKENNDVSALSLSTEPGAIQDWSEHRLVLGDRYETDDFDIRFLDGISRHSSGVLVCGIGEFGEESIDMLALSRFLRVYHVKGRLGWATDNHSPKGRILERTRFKHVNRAKLERLCAATQAAHTRQMYSLHGVNPDSQEAYEMAAKGIIRPGHEKTQPILYGVKCIDFQPPDFTLEIHSINESCEFLRRLIHDLAIKLKTTAVCSGIRRLRHGNFDLSRALIRQHWRLDHIIDNIDMNLDLLAPERLFVGPEAEQVQLLSAGQREAGFLPEGELLIDENGTEIEEANSALNDDNEHLNEIDKDSDFDNESSCDKFDGDLFKSQTKGGSGIR